MALAARMLIRPAQLSKSTKSLLVDTFTQAGNSDSRLTCWYKSVRWPSSILVLASVAPASLRASSAQAAWCWSGAWPASPAASSTSPPAQGTPSYLSGWSALAAFSSLCLLQSSPSPPVQTPRSHHTSARWFPKLSSFSCYHDRWQHTIIWSQMRITFEREPGKLLQSALFLLLLVAVLLLLSMVPSSGPSSFFSYK